MIKIKDTTDEAYQSSEFAISPIWRQAFRSFFLAGAFFSIICMLLWGLYLGGEVSFLPYGGALFWHAHEMLFGFVSLIIAGFLLTAVQNWTGIRSTHGNPLIILLVLWLSARVLMFTGFGQGWILMVVDVSFILVVAVLMAQFLIKAKSKRNYQFLPILLFFAVANTITHLSVILSKPELFLWGTRAAVLVIALLMVVVAGRLIPMFTASGTGTKPVQASRGLELAVIVSMVLIAILALLNVNSHLPGWTNVAIFMSAGLLNAVRVARWWTMESVRHSLVWSLHVAYWFIPIGLLLLALHYLGLPVTYSTGLHAITAGAIGSLILSVISRVSLGHSGRPIIPRRVMSVAFFVMFLAGIVRVFTGLIPELFVGHGLLIGSILWALAYVIYVMFYFRILTSPRADGCPG